MKFGHVAPRRVFETFRLQNARGYERLLARRDHSHQLLHIFCETPLVID